MCLSFDAAFFCGVNRIRPLTDHRFPDLPGRETLSIMWGGVQTGSEGRRGACATVACVCCLVAKPSGADAKESLKMLCQDQIQRSLC